MLFMVFLNAMLTMSQPAFAGHSLQPVSAFDKENVCPRAGEYFRLRLTGLYAQRFLSPHPLPAFRLPEVRVGAAQSRNGIGGYVFDTSRRPVVNLRIELLDEVDSVIATTRTDSSGRYSFRNLSQGTFQIRVLPDGTNLIGQTTRVQISNFSRSTSGGGRITTGTQFEQVDFTLKSRDEVKASSKPMSTGTTFAQNVPESARIAYEQAIQNLDKKNDDEQGIAGLKKAIELFPTYYLALERLGAEYLKRQNYESAAATLSKAIEVNPKGPSSLYALGVAQYYLKQMSEAIKSLRYSMSLAPDSPNAAFLHMYLGMALLKSGKTDESETHLKQAHVKGGKLLPDVHMHLAQIYSNGKRYKDAADELELFLAEMPNARDAERIKEIIKQLRAKAK